MKSDCEKIHLRNVGIVACKHKRSRIRSETFLSESHYYSAVNCEISETTHQDSPYKISNLADLLALYSGRPDL